MVFKKIGFVSHQNLAKLEFVKPQVVMFASSLRNYSDKGETISKLKPRLKSASSVSRVQEVFNKSLLPVDKRARAKSATLPSTSNEKKSQITSVSDTEVKIWPPIIKTHSVTSWKNPSQKTHTLTAIPYASQPVESAENIHRLMNYLDFEDFGKSTSSAKNDQQKQHYGHEKEARIRYYTYDSDVDSQEDGYELLESSEDLKDEGVEKIDLPPSSNRIIPMTKYNSLQQKNVRVVHRESSSYVSCPRCHTHVPIPTSNRIFTASSSHSEMKQKSPPLSPPTNRIQPQPIWQAEHAIELMVPKIRSVVTSPTLSLPSYNQTYYRSSERINTDDETVSTDQFLTAHSRPRPLSASFYCKKI